MALLLHSCEAFDKLPNGNFCFSLFIDDEEMGWPCTDTSSLGGVVAEWEKGGNARVAVVDKYGKIENWDTSDVLSLTNVFVDMDSFNEDISKWDTSQVTDMSAMFAYATAFNNGGQPLDWDTSSVTSMSAMFGRATAFNNGGQPLDWDTSQVMDMTFMFEGATAFNNGGQPLDWDTSSVHMMNNMFAFATAFNGDISQWNTASVTTMEEIFYNSGFSRTLCGGAWESLTGNKSAFNTLGTSTARYGCCPAGSFMSDPFVPFTEANSCSPCTAGEYGTNVKNDEPACTNCIAGKSNPSGTSDGALCQNCQAGQSSIAGALCQNCQAGQYSIAGALCQNCQAGQSSTAGEQCQNCQAGQYSLPGEACKNYSVQWLKNAYDSIGGTC